MPSFAADAVFWVAVACCVVAELFILRSTLLARGPQSGKPLPSRRRAAEVAWAVLPAVALALVLAATWRAIHPTSATTRTTDTTDSTPAPAAGGRASAERAQHTLPAARAGALT